LLLENPSLLISSFESVPNFWLELFFQQLPFPIEEASDYKIYFLSEGMLVVQIHALIRTS